MVSPHIRKPLKHPLDVHIGQDADALLYPTTKVMPRDRGLLLTKVTPVSYCAVDDNRVGTARRGGQPLGDSINDVNPNRFVAAVSTSYVSHRWLAKRHVCS